MEWEDVSTTRYATKRMLKKVSHVLRRSRGMKDVEGCYAPWLELVRAPPRDGDGTKRDAAGQVEIGTNKEKKGDVMS